MRTLATTTLALLATAAVAEQTKAEKDESFMQGLDQGFFMRNDLNGHRQFDCPDLVVQASAVDAIKDVMGPAKMMANMMGGKNDVAEQVSNVMGSMEIFIDEVMAFQALVNDYRGSDFCSGLLFGMHGSRMMIGLGKYMIDAIEAQGPGPAKRK